MSDKINLLCWSGLAGLVVMALLATASEKKMTGTTLDTTPPEPGHAYATFGGGCFWCTEAVFEGLEGVKSVVSGYEGGHVENPTYREVCSGQTGHAEVIRIEYDPGVVTYEQLLDYFFRAHDPTQLNRQGADVGTQYRSVIFYHSDEQKQQAEQAIAELEKDKVFGKPVVTEVSPTAGFYPAEDYHQDYYARNPNAGYCAVVIRPKMKKLGLE